MGKIDAKKIKNGDKGSCQDSDMEKALRESEEKYRTLFESSSDAIMLLDEKGFFDCNQATLRIFGIPRKEDFVKMHPSDLSPKFQPDGKRSFEEANKKIVEAYKNGTNHFEWVHRRIGGEDFFADVLLTAFNYEGKRVLQATVRDITKSRRIGAEHRLVLQTSLDGFYSIDLQGNISDVNDSYCAMIGYSREELLRMGIKDIDAIDSKEVIAARIQRMMKTGGERFETKHRRKDGNIIDIEASVKYLEEGGGKFFVFIRDITARKKVEQDLRLNGEIINNMSEGVYLIRLSDGKIVYTNPKFEEMFGYGKGEMIGKNVAMVNAPSKRSPEETAKEILEILNKTGEWHGEVENIKKDGTRFFCYASCSLLDHIEYGKVTVAVHTDITERKKLEEEMVKFKLGIDRSGDAVFITDTEGVIVYVNPAFEKIYGFTEEEVLGKTPRVIKSGLTSEEGYGKFWKMLLEKKTVAGEVINKRKDGAMATIEGSNNPIVDASGKIIGFLAVHRDITERKRKEEELREKTKELEEKNKMMRVKEQEIKRALENSERANKLMIGRELRMRDLKMEIIALNNKLKEKDKGYDK